MDTQRNDSLNLSTSRVGFVTDIQPQSKFILGCAWDLKIDFVIEQDKAGGTTRSTHTVFDKTCESLEDAKENAKTFLLGIAKNALDLTFELMKKE